VFACVLDFGADDVLVRIEVKLNSGGHLFGFHADAVGELDVQHVGISAQKIPQHEIALARKRLKEMRDEEQQIDHRT